MAKRPQQDSGEERVTAKSRPMMSLVARVPSIVSSSTSLSPWKRYYGKQDPWRSVVEDDNEQETSEMQFEEYALKLNAGDFASRSKAQAKPQRRDSASSSTRTIPIGENLD